MSRLSRPEPSAISRRALVAGGAAVLLGGCGLPRLPGLPGSNGTDPKPTAPAEAVTVDKLWDTSGVGQIDAVALAGDVVLLSGGLKSGRNIPFVADIGAFTAADGKQVWSSAAVDRQLAKLDPRLSVGDGQTVCGTGADAVVVVPTYQNPCPDGKDSCSTAETARTDGEGVAAIRAADGRLLWHNLALPAVSRSDPDAARRDDEELKVVAGDGTRVLYIGGADEVVAGKAPTPEQRIWTGMLNLTTGKELWRVDRVVGKFLAGDVVLVKIVGTGQGTGGLDSGQGPVAALDAATGRRLCSTSGTPDPLGRWLFGTAGLAGLSVSKADGTYKYDLLLDPRTGKTLHTEKHVMAGASVGLGPGGRPTAVWSSQNAGLFPGPDAFLRTWTGSGPLRTGSQKLSTQPYASMIVGDTVWCSYYGPSANSRSLALDLWGRPLCTPLVGDLSGADAGHVIMLDTDAALATIYRLS